MFKFLNGVAFKYSYGLSGSVWTEHLSVGIFDQLKIPPVPSERNLNLLLFFPPFYSSDTVILEYNNTTKIVVLNINFEWNEADNFFQEFLARLLKRKNSRTSLFLKIQRVRTVRSTFITLRSRLIAWQNWMNSIHFLGNKPSRMPWRSVWGGEGKENDIDVDDAELLRQIKLVGILLVGQTFIIKSLNTWSKRRSHCYSYKFDNVTRAMMAKHFQKVCFTVLTE